MVNTMVGGRAALQEALSCGGWRLCHVATVHCQRVDRGLSTRDSASYDVFVVGFDPAVTTEHWSREHLESIAKAQRNEF